MAEKEVKFGPEIPGQVYVFHAKDSAQQEWAGTLAFADDRQSVCFAANGESIIFPLDRFDSSFLAELIQGVIEGKFIGVLFEDDDGFIDDAVADDGATILTLTDLGWKVLIVGPPGKKGYATSALYPAKRYTVGIPESGAAVGITVEEIEEKFVSLDGLYDICLDDTLHFEPFVQPFKIFDGGHSDFWFRFGEDVELDHMFKSALPLLDDLKQGKRCLLSLYTSAHYCYKCEKGGKEQIVSAWGVEWSPLCESFFDSGNPSDSLLIIAKPGESLLLYFTDRALKDKRCLLVIFSEDGKSVSGRELIIAEGGA